MEYQLAMLSRQATWPSVCGRGVHQYAIRHGSCRPPSIQSLDQWCSLKYTSNCLPVCPGKMWTYRF